MTRELRERIEASYSELPSGGIEVVDARTAREITKEDAVTAYFDAVDELEGWREASNRNEEMLFVLAQHLADSKLLGLDAFEWVQVARKKVDENANKRQDARRDG